MLNLEKFFFGVDLDGAVAGGVGNAGENETLGDLVVIQEVLFGLIDGSVNHLSGAGGARSSTATVGKINSGFFGGIDNESIIGALKGFVNAFFFRDNLDGVSKRSAGHAGSRSHGSESGNGGNSDKKSGDDGLGEHGEYVYKMFDPKKK